MYVGICTELMLVLFFPGSQAQAQRSLFTPGLVQATLGALKGALQWANHLLDVLLSAPYVWNRRSFAVQRGKTLDLFFQLLPFPTAFPNLPFTGNKRGRS